MMVYSDVLWPSLISTYGLCHRSTYHFVVYAQSIQRLHTHVSRCKCGLLLCEVGHMCVAGRMLVLVCGGGCERDESKAERQMCAVHDQTQEGNMP